VSKCKINTVSSWYFHSDAPSTSGDLESNHSIKPVSLCTRRSPGTAGTVGGDGGVDSPGLDAPGSAELL
jgi:hypothetical protein